MTNECLYAYLAGAMDADGYFTIKKSTYHVRVVKDAKNPTYSESVGLRQVTPQIPYLLKDTFGGTVAISKGGTENSKPLYNYRATDKVAHSLCVSVLPYLRIKNRQAEILRELRESKSAKYRQESYWFQIEFPDWQGMEMIDHAEVTRILDYCNHTAVSLAIANGTLLALPYIASGPKAIARVPKLLVERLAERTEGRGSYLFPPQLLEWKERLYQEIRELNKIGVNGTSVYYRTGHHLPA